MELKIISKEAIRPSKPTQPHKLSILDQLSPSIYVPVLLFYQAPHTSINLSGKLKTSLAEALNHYYPLAGKIEGGGTHVIGDMEGAIFIEARTKIIKLSDILTKPDLKALNILFPDDLQWKSSRNLNMMAVQISYFDCGGYSIGLCISHKIADACTVSNFLNDWAFLTRQSGELLIRPLFNASSIFPPSDQFVIPEVEHGRRANVVTRRYVFHPLKISQLKAIVCSNSKIMHNPTRVEVVTSLVYKSIIKANKIRFHGINRPFLLAQIVNIRPRMVPPMPDNSLGNIVWYFPVVVKDDNDTSLESLVTQMRKGLAKLCDSTKNLKWKEWVDLVVDTLKDTKEKNVSEAYGVSSWCKCPLYQIDFGWGRPRWVSVAEYPYGNNIHLLDCKDGEGIEAWVTLDEDVMDILQVDDEFLKFVSLNPST